MGFLCALLASTSASLAALPQQTTNGILPGASAWYLSTQDGSGELFVFEIGTGEPVVVLHGGPGGDLTYMLPVARGLESEFRFVFYDQRGSLRSRVPPSSVSMANHVADLETLRNALGVERIHLLSHSAGTLLACAYLEEYADRVGNVVLAGALPHKNGGKYFDAEYAALWSSIPADAERFRNREALKEELRKAGSVSATKTPKQKSELATIRQCGDEAFHVERWREWLPIRVSPEAAEATRKSTNFEYDYGELLAGHSFPVTVINGELDFTVGPRGSPLWRKLAESAPNVHLVVIPEASHAVWFDAPAEFQSALRKALSK